MDIARSPYEREHLNELGMIRYDLHMIEIYDEFVPERNNRGVALDKSQFLIVNLNPADQGQAHLGAIPRLNYMSTFICKL